MSEKIETFDNRQPLPTPFEGLKRKVGVWISLPFYHEGLKQQCVCTEVSYPYFNEETFGCPGLPLHQIEAYKQEATEKVIARLDVKIRELQNIKTHLLKSIEVHEAHYPHQTKLQL